MKRFYDSIKRSDGKEKDATETVDIAKVEVVETPPVKANEPELVKFDHNQYATRKTISQGVLDIALLMSNASQLKLILHHSEAGIIFYVLLSLLAISIVIQIVIGVCLIVLGKLNINDLENQARAKAVNTGVTAGIFVLVAINVFIAAFGFSSQPAKTI